MKLAATAICVTIHLSVTQATPLIMQVSYTGVMEGKVSTDHSSVSFKLLILTQESMGTDSVLPPLSLDVRGTAGL